MGQTADELRSQIDEQRRDVSRDLEAIGDRVSPRLPWSGVKKSGVGLTLSTYGIQTFTRPKAWHLRSG